MSIIQRAKSDVQGPFSKASRHAAQRFSILKETNEILHGSIRRAKPFNSFAEGSTSQLPKLSLTEIEVSQLVKNETEMLQRSKAVQRHKSKAQIGKSPLFSTQSRDAWYRTKVGGSQDRRDEVPPCGWYNVNYTLLDR